MGIMNRWKGKVAVVTGASSGIGEAIARALIKEGMIVAGLARREEQMKSSMKHVKGAEMFHAFKCDITKEQQVIETFQSIKEKHGTVQVLVNSAGLGTFGPICDSSKQDWEHIFQVNVMGLLQCTIEAVKMMKDADVEGQIININSIQGHRVYNVSALRSNVYAATKHAVTAITETLQNEEMHGKVKFTSISPGLTNTEILSRNGFNSDAINLPRMQAQDVADAAIYVLGTPQRVQVTELTLRPFRENRG